MPSNASAKQCGGMTFEEIGRREGISSERARVIFLRGMEKLRGIPRRDLIEVLKFYGDALEGARDGAVTPEAMI